MKTLGATLVIICMIGFFMLSQYMKAQILACEKDYSELYSENLQLIADCPKIKWLPPSPEGPIRIIGKPVENGCTLTLIIDERDTYFIHEENCKNH